VFSSKIGTSTGEKMNKGESGGPKVGRLGKGNLKEQQGFPLAAAYYSSYLESAGKKKADFGKSTHTTTD